jgi:hypothetical protein
MNAPTLEQIEAELQQARQQLADQPTDAVNSNTALAIQQLQAGINILRFHSAANIAGSLFSDALIQFNAALKTLQGI